MKDELKQLRKWVEKREHDHDIEEENQENSNGDRLEFQYRREEAGEILGKIDLMISKRSERASWPSTGGYSEEEKRKAVEAYDNWLGDIDNYGKGPKEYYNDKP